MSPSPRRTLVTGAGRPLGIELVRQSLLRGDKVYAASRNPARIPVLADLRAEFPGLELLALDPADAASVAEAIPVLEALTSSLDLLVIAPAEAGAHERVSDAARDESLSTMSGTGLVEHYRRHAVAPVLLVRTLLPWLSTGDGARVLMVTTGLGSLANKTAGGEYASSASAAALHMLTRALANDLSEHGITVCLGNPGDYAAIPDEPAFRIPMDEAALGLLSITDRLARERSGAYLDYTGAERPW
ncbi:MAG: SDR family NAD(P)-dependent oxidoreductase [Gemmatimonadaceae bacterium]|nr:SDR family NAD(P)-dependent oxidoreductase [Gemmatimonadaceae bacterium]